MTFHCRHGTSYKDSCNGFSHSGCPRTEEEANQLCYHGVKYGTRCGECECVRPAAEVSRDVTLVRRALEAAARVCCMHEDCREPMCNATRIRAIDPASLLGAP